MRSLFVLIALFAGALAVGVESQSELERRGRRQGKGRRGGRKLAAGLRPRRDPVDLTDFDCPVEQTITNNWWNQECECIEMSLYICDGTPVWNQVTNKGTDDTANCESVVAPCPFGTD